MKGVQAFFVYAFDFFLYSAVVCIIDLWPSTWSSVTQADGRRSTV